MRPADSSSNVSQEAEIAGRAAARYARGELPRVEKAEVFASDGVRYALPQRVSKGEGKVKLFFRVDNVYKSARLVVECGDKQLLNKKFQVLAPGEMGSVEIERSDITGDISVRLER